MSCCRLHHKIYLSTRLVCDSLFSLIYLYQPSFTDGLRRQSSVASTFSVMLAKHTPVWVHPTKANQQKWSLLDRKTRSNLMVSILLEPILYVTNHSSHPLSLVSSNDSHFSALKITTRGLPDTASVGRHEGSPIDGRFFVEFSLGQQILISGQRF